MMPKLKRRDVLKALPVAAASVAAASCGYSLAGRGSFLPEYIRAIAIPVFLNVTPYLTIEQVFTEKVRIEFQSRGRYRVLPSATDAGADGLVQGEILAISASPVSFSDQRLASRYRFNVTISVKFDDLQKKTTLWENPALTFSDEYELSSRSGVTAGATAFIDQERVVFDRLASDFARSVVSAILEAF
jgi:hypothetical protein